MTTTVDTRPRRAAFLRHARRCAAVATAAGAAAAPLAAEEAEPDGYRPDRPAFVHIDHGSVVPARVHEVVSTEVTDLVLVPAGYRDGYRPGMICRVSRDGNGIAEILMVEVRDEASAGIIVALFSEEIIEPGDVIRVKTVQHQR